MAITKVLGTETEYGVIIRNRSHQHQALAAAAVIDGYPGGPVRVQWSYEHESPGNDSRGFGHENFGIPEPESALINSVLTNGAPSVRGPLPSRILGSRMRGSQTGGTV